MNYPITKTKKIRARLNKELRRELTDRQQSLWWWSQPRIDQARICQIGAGGLGGPTARILVQTGAAVDVVDHDRVELSNLNRQLFTVKDIGKPKAHALLDNISLYATRAMTIRGYRMTVAEFSERCDHQWDYDEYLVGVDNDSANIDSAKLALRQGKTAVFINVSRDGEACRVFIQRPGGPCFACYKPRALEPRRPVVGCPRTPAIADVLQVAAGLAVRAIIGELMGEPIGDYNCRDLSLSGFDHAQTIARRPECPLCRDRSGDEIGRV